MFTALIIGAGHSRDLRLSLKRKGAVETITVDINPDVRPDVLHDLNKFPWPFPAEYFDEVHAYEVLEHLGAQGDYQSFFHCFNNVWRILKPNGYLCATCPSASSIWAWGDPGHTRIISPASLVFLQQSEYVKQLDGENTTSMSDYRNIYTADFRIIHCNDDGETHSFILQAVKPSE